jgi:mycofactocin system glycosyltransferase
VSTDRRYRLDESARRTGDVLLAGSPLRVFRLTPAGTTVLDEISRGVAVPASPLVDRLLDAGAIHPLNDSRPVPDDLVTIVVPVRGRIGPTAPRTIVVDDGSDPPVSGATIRLATNQGPAAARDAGLAEVTTPLVAFVDADVVLPDGWLEPLVAHFDDPRVGLVAPRIRSTPGTSVLARYERRRSPLDLGPEPARIRAGTRVSYVPAAAIVCRTRAVREAGGFDPDLRFGEDVDLVWRLDRSGWRCRYEPGVEVHHDPRPTWAAWAYQRIGYGSSAAPLAKRHPGALAPVRASGWSAAAWALVVSGHPMAAVVLTVGTGAALVRKLPFVPARTSFELATVGTARLATALASAVRRVWWPLVLLAAVRSRRARVVAVVAAVAAGEPLRVLDDACYGAGVWRGMWRERTIEPLLPEIAPWPPRRNPDRG